MLWNILLLLGLGLLLIRLIPKLIGGILRGLKGLVQRIIRLGFSILAFLSKLTMRLLLFTVLCFIGSFFFVDSGELSFTARFGMSAGFAIIGYFFIRFFMHMMNIPQTRGHSGGGGGRPYGHITAEPISVNGGYDEVRYFYNYVDGIEYPIDIDGSVTIDGVTYNARDLT